MPDQEFPRPSARSYRPDRDDEDPPPWANMPPVRPTRPRHLAGAANPSGSGRPAGDTQPGGPSGRISPEYPQWDEPETDGDPDTPPAQPPGSRGPGGRALRAAARRRRRWFIMAGTLVVVAGAVLSVVLLAANRPGPATVTPGTLITTFQPGELQQVPSACSAVPGGTVHQYLPGKAKVTSPLPVDGSAESACNWTVDQPPVYRLMELNLLAYAPNGLASGDGSATFAAIDAYQLALQDMQTPPKHSPAPPATVRTLSGFGNQAFSAMQVFRVGGAVTDVATVVVRYHNVVVTVTLNGLAHSNRGSYGPVSQSQLASAALAFAQAAEASLH